MLQRGVEFVRERVTGTAAAIAARAAALNHEIGNHAVEGEAVIEGALFFLSGALVGKFLGAFGKTDEVGYGLRRFLFEQADHNFALRGFKNSVRSRWPCHEFS